uniref:Uncharacterized protein n=1 Tax=Arundo donax TaxID=35708 RepID=A0A0A8XSN2_ARUDO
MDCPRRSPTPLVDATESNLIRSEDFQHNGWSTKKAPDIDGV